MKTAWPCFTNLPRTLCLVTGLSALAATLVPSFASASAAYEQPPNSYIEGALGFSTTSEYFTTTANYEPSRGEFTSLPYGAKFTTWENHFRGRYTPAPRFSLFAGTTYTSSTAQSNLPTKTNSRITEAFGGIDWLIFSGTLQLTIEAIGSYPIDVTEAAQLVPMTNDGVGYFRPGAFLQKSFRRFRLTGYAGFHVPTQYFATRFLYEATVDMRVFWWFTVGGGIDGYETVSGDTTNLLTRQSSAALANVGSERYYSYNPALLEGRAWIGIRPSKQFWLRVGYAQTINGLHTAAGNTYLLSLVWNSGGPILGGGPDYPALPPARKPPSSPDALRSFEPDVEPSDQTVFEMDDEDYISGKSALDRTEKLLEKRTQGK